MSAYRVGASGYFGIRIIRHAGLVFRILRMYETAV